MGRASNANVDSIETRIAAARAAQMKRCKADQVAQARRFAALRYGR